jgi:hypothetical protein
VRLEVREHKDLRPPFRTLSLALKFTGLAQNSQVGPAF